jgi:hypothetical protein
MVDDGRRLLASLRDGQDNAALLNSSRTMIDESRRLLAALERLAPARRSDDAHHDGMATPGAASIEPGAGGVRANADRNSAMLSVRVFQEGTRYSWTLNTPGNEVLGHGTAKTARQARIDALQAGMTYIDRAKDRSSPGNTSLH